MSAALSNNPTIHLIDAAPVANVGDTDLLTRLIRDFEMSEEASYEARLLSERDRNYYDGLQLTDTEIAALRKRRQPPSVNNYIQRKIDLLRGMERRGRSDFKAYPRNPDQAQHAQAVTQTLRFVADENRFDVTRSQVYENMMIEGYGGAEVIVEPTPVNKNAMNNTSSLVPQTKQYDVVINYVPWDRLFYDPHSFDPGFNDARYRGCVLWMGRDEALERWPGREDVIEASYVGTSVSDTYDDKPRWQTSWADGKRTRVRIVQMHFKQGGDWWTATFTRGGFMEPPAPSPYLDRHGRSACPLIMRSAYVDRQNNRYGIVRSMISMQEAINKRESKLLHLLNVNQIVMEEGAVQDVDEVRNEAAKPDGVIVKQPGMEFEIRRDQSQVAGHFEMLQYSVAQMNANGPNASMAGKDPRELSGRAIIAQQSGGMVESEHLADSLRQWVHKIGEASWMRVRQYVTAEKMVRITDSEKNVQFLALNHPVTVGEELSKMPPEQAQQIVQRMGIQGPNDPRMNFVLRVDNNVDDMDVDIVVEEGPDVPTLQHETWQAFVQLPPQVLVKFPPAAFIKMNPGLQSDDKDQLLKMLEDEQKQQAAQAQQQQQAAQAMQAAQVADKQAQAADRQAQAVSRMHKMAVEHAQATQPQTTMSLEQPSANPTPMGQAPSAPQYSSPQPAGIPQP